jgi:phosphatidylglycerol---prolipoprotein diacylglyceryl transferase
MKTFTKRRAKKIEARNEPENGGKPWPTYWYPILLFWLFAAALFGSHLIYGTLPNRTLVTVPIVELDIYWYGFVIVSGIGLGAYVSAHLVAERARRSFEMTVPAGLRALPLAELSLPEELTLFLTRRKVNTVGDAIFNWGLNPAQLGLDGAGLTRLRKELLGLSKVKVEWLDSAPWRSWNPDHVWNGIIICLLFGLIGARLYHVLTPSPSMAAVGIHSPLDYFRHPFMLINLRLGGLGIYGGIAGGLIGLIWYTARHRLPTLAWADVAAIGLALGQAVGRWGNFFNQELYGRPTELPWAIFIEPNYRLPGYRDFSHFHPAFLYESLWNFLAFVLLLTLFHRYRNRLLQGELLALYLILYAVGRTLLETVRLDSRTLSIGATNLGLPIATVVSLIVAILMIIWIVWRRRHLRRPTIPGW